jgi:VanZ family protein
MSDLAKLAAKRNRQKAFITVYALLLAIGSLYPFSGWLPMSEWSLHFLIEPWPRYVTRTDLVTNLLVYVPLGYALALIFARPGHGARGVIVGAVMCALLSLSMETGQAQMPARIASNLDLLVNSLGALIGALFSLHHGRWLRAGRALGRWRVRWFRSGLAANLGLLILLLWFLAQFSLRPFPGIDWLALHLQPIDTPPRGINQINLPWFAAVFLEIITLGVVAATLLRPGRYVGGMLLLLGSTFLMKLLAATLLLKLKVVGGMLSLETLSAFLLALWFLLNPYVSRHRWRIAFMLLLTSLLLRLWLADFQVWPTASLLNLVGLAKAAAIFWPWLALILLTATWLTNFSDQSRRRH